MTVPAAPAARITNKTFAENDEFFSMACERAGLPATGRQAGKFRTGRGQAFASRPTPVLLAALGVKGLRVALTRSGIAFRSKDRKADLIALLRGE